MKRIGILLEFNYEDLEVCIVSIRTACRTQTLIFCSYDSCLGEVAVTVSTRSIYVWLRIGYLG